MDVLRPRDEMDLCEIITTAQAPLSIGGGRTRGMARAGQPLDTARINGIELYEPGALTLVVNAGTSLDQVERILADEKQRLAFEPMDHRQLLGCGGQPTIGGVFAANISGPRRIAVGAARDFSLGVRYVDGAGRRIKNGGRVMKNVTGYDLVKLQCGARGTLGVVTQIAFKVLPLPETSASLAVPARTARTAVDILSQALSTPFEVTGAAWDGAQALIRVEGFEASVRYRVKRLREILGGDPSDFNWREIRDVHAFADLAGDVWRISVRPSDAPGLVEKFPARVRCMLDWGGGLIWALCPARFDLPGVLGHIRGYAMQVRGQGANRVNPQPDPVTARIESRLRGEFDPKGLFSSEYISQ